jgi:alanine-glyoxylate transaminase / serine-glyoxylate transaminase / serine-pyruvate transaminase
MTKNLSVSQGRHYLAIPGPSVIPDAVLQAMHKTSPNIYAGELVDMTHAMIPDLRRVACTDHHVAMYIANGHGTWEAALSNVIAPGERVLVPATGAFGHGWAEMAQSLGAIAEIVDFGRDESWDLQQLHDVLKPDVGGTIKAVLAVHVDTSSSVRNSIVDLRGLLDDLGHPALLMADCVASLGCDRFEMDRWGVDVTVSASQKGLMVPPGMGFVFFNDKAEAVRQAMPRVSRYWDWTPRIDPEVFYLYFDGTAPTQHLYGLREALNMIHSEGIDHVWARHQRLAQAIWAACDAWASDGPLRLNVAEPTVRSHAVTTLKLPTPLARDLRNWVEQNLGITFGISLGMEQPDDPDGDGVFRLGHMGHVNGQMILAMLGAIQTGLTALTIPHGSGAIEAAAGVLAGQTPGPAES